jgi:hypothetical protein
LITFLYLIPSRAVVAGWAFKIALVRGDPDSRVLATAQARYRQLDNSGCRNKKRHVFNDWALESADSQTIPRAAIQDVKASNLDVGEAAETNKK